MKNGDIVLVRDTDSENWELDVFVSKLDEEGISYICEADTYAQCILYKGNEELFTTSSPYKDAKMTATEILELVGRYMSVSDFAYGEFNTKEGNLKSIGDWKEVDQYDGEGQGDDWYSIKYFKDHGVYIRTDGHYQSYAGTDFHYGFGKEVKPKQKTITVYE